MKTHVIITITVLTLSSANVWAKPANTHCSANEQTLFSCQLKNNKTVSLCASNDFSATGGYLQYRFGKIGKVELTLPKAQSGMPEALRLTQSKDTFAEYNDLTFNNGPFIYELTSFRQLKKLNKDGLPTPASSDTLLVRDDRKGMKEGDVVFTNDCKGLGKALDAAKIAGLSGVTLEKGGF